MTPTKAVNPRSLLTTSEVCGQLGVARSTLYKWWEQGSGPRRSKYPNGSLRVRQQHLDDFVMALEVAP